MGQLVDGTWHDDWYDTASAGGAFQRSTTAFRNWITPDGAPGPSGEGGFPAAAGRYHLYVSHACPWAHRTLIMRALKGLEDAIEVSVVHPDMLSDGWTFDAAFPGATGDRLHGLPFARDLYLRADPGISGRVTVPILWDSERGTIVSNESAEIIRMLGSAFDGLGAAPGDYYPEARRQEIEEVNARVYPGVNNGVYRAGFATTQAAYDEAAAEVTDTMAWLDDRLSGRDWLVADAMTEADIRLFTTMVRFDAVYHGHFKCNRAKLIEYPALWRHTRRMFQHAAIGPTVHMAHIARHYHYSHETINPHRIVPIGPDPDFGAPL